MSNKDLLDNIKKLREMTGVGTHHLFVLRLGHFAHAQVERASEPHPVPGALAAVDLELVLVRGRFEQLVDFLFRASHQELTGWNEHHFHGD